MWNKENRNIWGWIQDEIMSSESFVVKNALTKQQEMRQNL